MITLSNLKNTHRPHKKVQRVGRGVGSKRGKTCGRGNKGDRSRRGYKTSFGKEGGQMPLYRKLPCRGFVNGRFKSDVYAINLSLIEMLYGDGEVVNMETLRQKGYAPRTAPGGLKILANGDLKKKVTIEAHALSKAAEEKLKKLSIPVKMLTE